MLAVEVSWPAGAGLTGIRSLGNLLDDGQHIPVFYFGLHAALRSLHEFNSTDPDRDETCPLRLGWTRLLLAHVCQQGSCTSEGGACVPARMQDRCSGSAARQSDEALAANLRPSA